MSDSEGRYDRPTGCQHTTKQHFHSEEAADRRLAFITANPRTETIPIRTYKCRCGKWCMSSRPAGATPKSYRSE